MRVPLDAVPTPCEVSAMRVAVAERADLQPWLHLAAEVEDLFGHPMSSDLAFFATLERNVARGSAFVVRAEDGAPGAPLAGAMLWRPSRSEIGWLAVARAHRRRGVGRLLVRHAISLAGGSDVWVATFGSTVPGGSAAIALYRSCGFVDAGAVAGLPPELDRVRMRRPGAPPGWGP